MRPLNLIQRAHYSFHILMFAYSNNMPIGLQLMSKPLTESLLLQTAYNFEKVTDYNKQIAKL